MNYHVSMKRHRFLQNGLGKGGMLGIYDKIL